MAAPVGNEKKWFIAFSDHHEGPFTPEEVRGKISGGGIGNNPFIWCEGMKEWTRFEDTPLAKQAPPPVSSAVPPPMPKPGGAAPVPVVTPAKSKAVPQGALDENELSGFYELSPKSAEDRTEFIDKSSLKEARKEAKKAIRIESAARGEEAGGSPKRVQMMILAAGVVIILILLLKYGNII